MGRKSKNHKKFIAIIVVTESIKEVVELDKKEKIKNLKDLYKLPKIRRNKYCRKKGKLSKLNEGTNEEIKDINKPIVGINALFSDQSYLNDFTIDGKNLQDLDIEAEKIDYLTF